MWNIHHTHMTWYTCVYVWVSPCRNIRHIRKYVCVSNVTDAPTLTQRVKLMFHIYLYQAVLSWWFIPCVSDHLHAYACQYAQTHDETMIDIGDVHRSPLLLVTYNKVSSIIGLAECLGGQVMVCHTAWNRIIAVSALPDMRFPPHIPRSHLQQA